TGQLSIHFVELKNGNAVGVVVGDKDKTAVSSIYYSGYPHRGTAARKPGDDQEKRKEKRKQRFHTTPQGQRGGENRLLIIPAFQNGQIWEPAIKRIIVLSYWGFFL